MAICINQSGTWRNTSTVCVNQSGTWRNACLVCVNESGTWKRAKGPAPPTTLGASYGGGRAICFSSGVVWVVAPSSSEVSRDFFSISNANTRAQQVSGCTGWFVPSLTDLQNGYNCRSYWDSYSLCYYWSSTDLNNYRSGVVLFGGAAGYACDGKTAVNCVRSFRCVTY